MFATDPLTPLRALMEEGRFRDAVAWRRDAGPALADRPEGMLLAATAAMRTGEVALSRLDAMAALEAFEARADPDGRMRCHNLLGAIAFETGEVDAAQAAFASALRLAQDADDALVMARASNNLASVAHLEGRSAEALSLYRTALLAYQRLGDRRGAAETYHNLAVAFRGLQAWDDALDASRQAVRHAEQTGEPWLLSLVVAGKAEVHLAMEDLELASHEVERAERLAVEADDPVGQGEAYRLRGAIALASDDPGTALAQAQHGLELARAVGSALLEGECAALAALACRALDRPRDMDEFRHVAEQRFHRLGASGFLQDLHRRLAE